jgi:hypothetical protein
MTADARRAEFRNRLSNGDVKIKMVLEQFSSAGRALDGVRFGALTTGLDAQIPEPFECLVSSMKVENPLRRGFSAHSSNLRRVVALG